MRSNKEIRDSLERKLLERAELAFSDGDYKLVDLLIQSASSLTRDDSRIASALEEQQSLVREFLNNSDAPPELKSIIAKTMKE